MVVGRGDLDEVHADEIDGAQAPQDSQRLGGAEAAGDGGASARREGRVEPVA